MFAAALIVVGFVVVYPVQTQAAVNTGIEFAAQTGLSGQDIRVTIARIIRIILGFLGIIAIGLIMYAGWLWMSSGGNEEKIAQAKLILRNAAIGLIIILASFGIATFVLNQLLGATGGGPGTPGGGGNNGGGIGALGSGIIKSVYPEPYQEDVPRNTAIIVTFREPMLATSICDAVTNESPARCAPGAKIKPNSIKIYKTTVGDNGSTNVTNVSATSTDNTTFVFKPAGPSYLGSPIESTNYTVKLTKDVKKANGSDAFNLSDFYWSFEVNNLLDLAPPRIKAVNEGGIFPGTDNEADIISGISQATKAIGNITVSGNPNTYQAAAAQIVRTSPAGAPVNARIEGTNQCATGYILLSLITQGNGFAARVSYSQPGLQPADIAVVNNRVNLSPCSMAFVLEPNETPAPAAGHAWRINVTAERQADTLTVGSKTYSFATANPTANQIIVIPNNNSQTAQNISAAINAIHPEVTASVSQSTVRVQAKVAGSAGNSLELSTSNSLALQITPMSGGADQQTTYSIKDKNDQPKNAVIQINFNEPINPLTASGDSGSLVDTLRVVNADDAALPAESDCTQDSQCRSYKCSNAKCAGDSLAGIFTLSNQYKTVEFISNTKCGVNGCGENIYCLPANSNLKVEAIAASLQACSSNSDCTTTPYTTCSGGLCQDPQTNTNYPAASTINGIVDLADNSFDGNRNANAQGQSDTFYENRAGENPGRGDNYRWSFWISDRLDLTAPAIFGTSVNNNQGNVNLTDAIEIVFTKLMMSSSIATGTITINNGLNEIVHKLINLWSVANDPIGYWVYKEDRDVDPLDGRPDRTSVYLAHGAFNDSTAYQSQVGSGVKDIYQNCYKPSKGPNCNPGPSNPSCCREANPPYNLVPTTNLTAEGNCP